MKESEKCINNQVLCDFIDFQCHFEILFLKMIIISIYGVANLRKALCCILPEFIYWIFHFSKINCLHFTYSSMYIDTYFYPFPNNTFLTPKLNEFAVDILKCDEIEQYSSERAENCVEKGKIARYEQSLLFPQCFPKSSATKSSNVVIVLERVKS